MATALSDQWIIQRFVRLARPSEGEDIYETWPGYEKGMSQSAAEHALDECVLRWPDFEFRAHRVRVYEKIAADAIVRARQTTNSQ